MVLQVTVQRSILDLGVKSWSMKLYKQTKTLLFPIMASWEGARQVLLYGTRTKESPACSHEKGRLTSRAPPIGTGTVRFTIAKQEKYYSAKLLLSNRNFGS